MNQEGEKIYGKEGWKKIKSGAKERKETSSNTPPSLSRPARPEPPPLPKALPAESTPSPTSTPSSPRPTIIRPERSPQPTQTE